jgi:hypothetical protein
MHFLPRSIVLRAGWEVKRFHVEKAVGHSTGILLDYVGTRDGRGGMEIDVLESPLYYLPIGVPPVGKALVELSLLL